MKFVLALLVALVVAAPAFPQNAPPSSSPATAPAKPMPVVRAPVQLRSPALPLLVTLGILAAGGVVGGLWLRNALRLADRTGDQRLQAFRAAETRARDRFLKEVTSLARRPREAVRAFAGHRTTYGLGLERTGEHCENDLCAETDARKQALKLWFGCGAVAACAAALAVAVTLA